MKALAISVLLASAVAVAIPEAAAGGGYGGFRGVHGRWVGWGYGRGLGYGDHPGYYGYGYFPGYYGYYGYGYYPGYFGYGYNPGGGCWQSVQTLAGPATTYICH